MAIQLPLLSPSERRRARIVATLGPASRDPGTIREMIQNGVDVFRLNLSHGEHSEHLAAIEAINDAKRDHPEPVAILADLCGPKIRVGTFENDFIELKPKEKVTVTTEDVPGRPGLIPCTYQGLPDDVKPGNRLLLDDGLLELRAEEVKSREIICTVVHGGTLKNRKGMNLPGVKVSAPTLTEKDRADARFALEQGVDFLALSFVRSPVDVIRLKVFMEECKRSVPVIAKIEKPEALNVIDEILDVAEGIMVARGDLGVETAPEQVPFLQDELVMRARRHCRPVIVATQMLESMVRNPAPTRAEVADVSHAVHSGADAVMLSAETSVGSYPLRAISMMDRIARQVEGWQLVRGGFPDLPEASKSEPHGFPLRHAVARSTSQLSRDLKAKVVVVRTKSGPSAAVMASTRPTATLLAMTTDPDVWKQFALLWGVIPRLISEEEFREPEGAARRLAREVGLAKEGDWILLVAGFGKEEPRISALRAQ